MMRKGQRLQKVTKQRELGTTGEEISFKLKVVDMGIGKFGKHENKLYRRAGHNTKGC